MTLGSFYPSNNAPPPYMLHTQLYAHATLPTWLGLLLPLRNTYSLVCVYFCWFYFQKECEEEDVKKD